MKAQSALRAAFTGDTDSKGYVRLPQENLLPDIHLEQFENDLRGGDGNELRMKFCAVHSSSALALNSFAPLDSFPIVKRKDEAKFNGDYRTKRTILEMYTLAESIQTGKPYQARLDLLPADLRYYHPPRKETLCKP